MEHPLKKLIQSFAFCQAILKCKDDSIPDTGLPVRDWVQKGEIYLASDIKQNINSAYGDSGFSYRITDKKGNLMVPFDGYESYKAERFDVVDFICF